MNKNKTLNLLNTTDLKKASTSCSQNNCNDMLNAVEEATRTNNVAALENACDYPAFSMEYNLKLKPKHGDIPLCDNDTKKIPPVNSILNKVKAQVAEPKYAYSTNISDDKYAKITDSKNTFNMFAESKSITPIAPADSKLTSPPVIVDTKLSDPVIKSESKTMVNKPNISTDANAKRIASNVSIFKSISLRYLDNTDKLLVCVLYFMNECFYEKKTSDYPPKTSDIPEYNPNIGAGLQYFRWYVDLYNNVHKFGNFTYDYKKFEPLIKVLYPNKEKDTITYIRNKYFETDILKKEQVLTEVFQLMEFTQVWNKMNNKQQFITQVNDFWTRTIGNDINIKQFIEKHKDVFKGGKLKVKSKRNKHRTKKNKTRSNRKSRK